MKKILILGAGLVARPLVRYLLASPDIEITLADQMKEKAEELIGNDPSGTAIAMDVNNREVLGKRVAEADIVISLLPWTLHPMVARLCLDHKKHLVTASYVKDEMQAMDSEAREKGLIFLNEIGVDPGVDHMAAMKIIDEIKGAGGTVTSFYSYCGGLPAMANNNNPLGYKFSWSPEGAMMAANNDGRYLKNGKIIEVPGNKLFEHYWLTDIPGSGVFEAYVNRDALPYLKVYGIESAKTIYRGTLRNIGYCETWDFFKKLGLLNRKMMFNMSDTPPCQVIANMINSDGKNIKKDVAEYLKIPEYSLTLKKLQWLGMFSSECLDIDRTVSVFEMFAHVLKQKLTYDDGEVDLLLQHHEFTGEYPDGKKEKVMATLVDSGTPGGDSSMSKTVGLPAAIAARLIAEEKIDLKGVCIPVHPQIYKPVLNELDRLNIRFCEKRTVLTNS
ncbi:putative Saccharopine dehydrogenase (NADP+, L-glutamate-forming) [Desulfamplus magnetovallimortis]|uniref:Putative Saccharopine dehydrogenase (NADP+, L-glutamate-forming) n=1 Tax=Desulfamplus magnetovallimortis TaxID=1246637 RepID=A0A1W1HJ15_9BACT|nr:saccharopine dehydrogenase C-terminal domain-containing protein [Desulfamplus magnetovallimortis]SLM32469.1 putative Saccharopine dehydrogenase (NADP+, L-glutamate-forming) [Desulfamplus magnetovallimortis]